MFIYTFIILLDEVQVQEVGTEDAEPHFLYLLPPGPIFMFMSTERICKYDSNRRDLRMLNKS
jgi:hypothetical protein